MLIQDDQSPAIEIELVAEGELDEWLEGQPDTAKPWLERARFKAKANEFAFLPNGEGAPDRLVVGIGESAKLESIADLPGKLPPGNYRLSAEGEARYPLLLGWGLGAYRFDEYREPPEEAQPQLFIREEDAPVLDEVAAVARTRDLVNRPTEYMLPHDLENAAREIADAYGAAFEVTVGEELLKKGYNAIHTVGRASASKPRLIDIRWGDPEHPKITLAGKGVCFDSGGLNIKPAGGMRQMKKDMGGAAHALGLAELIMRRKLPVRLRVLVPAVENAISANAYRPGDVIRTYKGITIEVDNTDAEGRIILSDALALAAEEAPEAIIDFATLTGAARVALGTELPAMFASDDEIASGIIEAGNQVDDEVWRMPLHPPYRELIKSKVADIINTASTPYGGAITAALLLERFVDEVPWVHLDIMAMNMRHRPGHPEGGEAMGLRAVYGFLQSRYG